MGEDYSFEPNFKGIIRDFQHFLNVRGDNHKFMEHLFVERLKVSLFSTPTLWDVCLSEVPYICV